MDKEKIAEKAVEAENAGAPDTAKKKKPKTAAIIAVILAAVLLLGGGAAALIMLLSGGGNASIVSSDFDTKGKTVAEVTDMLRESGLQPAFISVYDEGYEDGEIIITSDFVDKATEGYITVAINDLSLRKNIKHSYLAPLTIPAASFEELLDEASKDEEKMLESYYNAYEDVYLLDFNISDKQKKALSETFHKSGYTESRMFDDYYAMGYIPTLTSSIYADVLTKENCEYTLANGGCVITKYKGDSGNIVIPEKIGDLKVVGFTINEFNRVEKNYIWAVTYNHDMETFGGEHQMLLNINSGDADTYFDRTLANSIFAYQDGSSVMIDDVLVAYEGDAEELTLPETARYIAAGVFYDNDNVRAVSLPQVRTVGVGAFHGCDSLEKVTVGSSLMLGEKAFYFCRSLKEIEYSGAGGEITVIENNCFEGCTALSKFDFSESLREIGAGAFMQTGLTEAYLGKNLTFLGASAFSGCSKLERVSILSYLTEGVTEISDSCFYQCSMLREVKLTSTIASIGSSAFFECESLTSIVIPDAVTKIENNAFSGCTSLVSVTLSGNLTTIGRQAFYNAGVKSISIPDSVTDIGDEAFFGCTSLAGFEGGSGVTAVGYGAFDGVKYFDDKGEFVMLGDILIRYNGSAAEVHVPAGVRAVSCSFGENGKTKAVYINSDCSVLDCRVYMGVSDIYIPEGVEVLELVGLSTWSDLISDNVYCVVHCKEGSSAHQYALDHSGKFELE